MKSDANMEAMRKKVDKIAAKKSQTDEEVDFMVEWVLKECDVVQKEMKAKG